MNFVFSFQDHLSLNRRILLLYFFQRSVRKMQGVLVVCFLLCIGKVCSQGAGGFLGIPGIPDLPVFPPLPAPNSKYPDPYQDKHTSKMLK